MIKRPVHSDFQRLLDFKSGELIQLYNGVRSLILNLCPECNELLYHTHALTSVYSLSEKLSDAFCMIPIYTNHLNLGFNKGNLLEDSNRLLKGTGNLIRHVEVKTATDFEKPEVADLILEAIAFAKTEMTKPSKFEGKTFSKIKI